MSDQIYHGGPAFPLSGSEDSNGNITYPEFGMTLRDYFAAKAMQAMVSTEYGERLASTAWAKDAYAIADAMLKAREVKS